MLLFKLFIFVINYDVVKEVLDIYRIDDKNNFENLMINVNNEEDDTVLIDIIRTHLSLNKQSQVGNLKKGKQHEIKDKIRSEMTVYKYKVIRVKDIIIERKLLYSKYFEKFSQQYLQHKKNERENERGTRRGEGRERERGKEENERN